MPILEIKIRIPSDKVQEFNEAFKLAVKRPPQYASLTDKQFIKVWLKDIFRSAIKTGKELKVMQTTSIDDYIEVD